MTAPVAFLFLGETLLIPHLWPIVEALADARPDLPIDCWVATSVHERLLAGWLDGRGSIRLRRAPGFRRLDLPPGANPPLPSKLAMLARLAPRLARARVAVCAEQTSLWLPRILPLPTRFIKTSHGVGSMSARDDPRRRAAWHTLVPGERERASYLDRGMAADRITATGYVKAAFRHRTPASRLFAGDRPVLLYTPHWQRHRSSWWDWGPALVGALARQQRWNVILAPHQRLAERAPDLREVLGAVAALPHVHVDLDSFATVDGSYTAAADLYLGDTSSQLLEYLIRPRPAVFLNAQHARWADDPSYAMWATGEVVDRFDSILPALERAPSEHPRFAPAQRDYAAASLGATDGSAPARCVEVILAALGQGTRCPT